MAEVRIDETYAAVLALGLLFGCGSENAGNASATGATSGGGGGSPAGTTGAGGLSSTGGTAGATGSTAGATSSGGGPTSGGAGGAEACVSQEVELGPQALIVELVVDKTRLPGGRSIRPRHRSR